MVGFDADFYELPTNREFVVEIRCGDRVFGTVAGSMNTVRSYLASIKRYPVFGSVNYVDMKGLVDIQEPAEFR